MKLKMSAMSMSIFDITTKILFYYDKKKSKCKAKLYTLTIKCVERIHLHAVVGPNESS